MLSIEDFGSYETAWCPGCGNQMILEAVKQALAEEEIRPSEVLFVSGIGQAAKSVHYLNCNAFNGLHGRALPAATGAKLANPRLKVIVESGDGCSYGEGGNHFLAALRRNVNLTMLVHNNQIYGLTKGQASPTTGRGHVTKAQPTGSYSDPFNPLAVALSLQAGFVARGFAGEKEHLKGLIQKAIRHPGFSLVDILQPCVSFNKINTFAWYKKRSYILGEEHDPGDWEAAMRLSQSFEQGIFLGVLYQSEKRPVFESNFPFLEHAPLAEQKRGRAELEEVIKSYV